MPQPSDLPPGVSEHDIPGNRPEDDDYEVKVERLFMELLDAACKTLEAGLEQVKPSFGKRKMTRQEIAAAVEHMRDHWQHKWDSL